MRTETVGGRSLFGCRASTSGAFTKGVPHSEQNFAAGAFSAAQLWQVLWADDSSDGVTGGLRAVPPPMAASTAAHPRGSEGAAGLASAARAGGEAALAPLVTCTPASAASSALIAKACSSSESVGSELPAGVSGSPAASACGARTAGRGASSDASL